MVYIATFSTVEIFRDGVGAIPAAIPTLEELYKYSPAPGMDIVLSYDGSQVSGSRWVLTSVDTVLQDMGDVLDELALAWTGAVDGWGNALFDPLTRAALTTQVNSVLDQDYGQTLSLTISELSFVYGAMLREYCYDIVVSDDGSLLTLSDIAKSQAASMTVRTASFGTSDLGPVTTTPLSGYSALMDTYGCKENIGSASNLWGPTHLCFDVYQNDKLVGTMDYPCTWVYYRIEKIEFYSTFDGHAPNVKRHVRLIVTIADNALGGTGRTVQTQVFTLSASDPNIIRVTSRTGLIPSVNVTATMYGTRCMTDDSNPGHPKISGHLWDISDQKGAWLMQYDGEPNSFLSIDSFTPYTANVAGVKCFKRIKPSPLFTASIERTEITSMVGQGNLVINFATRAPKVSMDCVVVADGDPVITTEQQMVSVDYNALISAWDAPDFNHDYVNVDEQINAITAKYIAGIDEFCAPWADYTADLVVERVMENMVTKVEDKDPVNLPWVNIADLTLEEARTLEYNGMTYGDLLDGVLTEEQALEYITFLQDVQYYTARRILLRGLIASSGAGPEAYNTINSALNQAKTAIEGSISFVRDVIDPRTRRALVYASAEMACMHEEVSDVVNVAQARGMTLESYIQTVDAAASQMVSNNVGLLIETNYQREQFRQQVLAKCNLIMPTNTIAEAYRDSGVEPIGAWLHDTSGAFLGKGSAFPEFLDIGHGLPAISQPLYVQSSRFPAELYDSFAATGLIKGRSLIINLKNSYIALSDGGAGMTMVSWHAKFYGGSDFDALVAIDKSMEEFLAMGRDCLLAAQGGEVTVTDASFSDEWLESRAVDVNAGDIIAWVANAGLVGSISAITGGTYAGLGGLAVGMGGQTLLLLTGKGIENEKRNAAIELYNSVHGPKGLTLTTGSNQYVDGDAYSLMLKGITWYILSGAITPIDAREGITPAPAVAFPGILPFRYLLTQLQAGIAPAVLTVVSILAIGSTIKYMRLPKVRAGHFMPGILAGALAAPLAWVSNQALEKRVSSMSSALSSYPNLIGVTDEETDVDVQEEIRSDIWDLTSRFDSMEADIKRAGSPEYAKRPYFSR